MRSMHLRRALNAWAEMADVKAARMQALLDRPWDEICGDPEDVAPEDGRLSGAASQALSKELKELEHICS